MKKVVITGVSSGIGYASAKLLLAQGFQVYGSVRQASDAARLSEEFGPAFKPLIFDIQDEKAVRAAGAQVGQDLAGEALAGLVLNAGIVVTGPLLHLKTADLRHQLEVNVIAQLALTQAFAPYLGVLPGLQGGPGRIVAISSIAGKLSAPFFGPYAASKHALEAFCLSLRRELMIYGIDVVVIGPGSVATPIWGKRDEEASNAFSKTDYAQAWSKYSEFTAKEEADGIPAAEVAGDVLKALTHAHPKARYVPIRYKFSKWTLPRLLPTRVLDNAMAKVFGLERRGV